MSACQKNVKMHMGPESLGSQGPTSSLFCNWRWPTHLLVTQCSPQETGLCLCTWRDDIPRGPHSPGEWPFIETEREYTDKTLSM